MLKRAFLFSSSLSSSLTQLSLMKIISLQLLKCDNMFMFTFRSQTLVRVFRHKNVSLV
jgi:hypothetical protein